MSFFLSFSTFAQLSGKWTLDFDLCLYRPIGLIEENILDNIKKYVDSGHIHFSKEKGMKIMN
jgi:hypothetical protein